MPDRIFQALAPWWDKLLGMITPLLIGVASRMVRCGVERRCRTLGAWCFEVFVALVSGTVMFFLLEALGVPAKWSIPGVSVAAWSGPEFFKALAFRMTSRIERG